MYEAIVNSSVDFVSIHFKDVKMGLKFQLNSMFETIHNEVEADIWDGQYDINKRNVNSLFTQNYFSINKKEQEQVAHITEELVRKNINSFRNELDQS